jgi:hypothetical protein
VKVDAYSKTSCDRDVSRLGKFEPVKPVLLAPVPDPQTAVGKETRTPGRPHRHGAAGLDWDSARIGLRHCLLHRGPGGDQGARTRLGTAMS